jgi:hypothetical protein
MRRPRPTPRLNQNLRRPGLTPKLNQNLRRRNQQNKVTNQPSIFITPMELLQMAPEQDKEMWKLIISRLPSDYTIPDPEFIHMYQSFIKMQN